MDKKEELHSELRKFKNGNYAVIVAIVIVALINIYQGRVTNELTFILFAQGGALVLARKDQFSRIGYYVMIALWLVALSVSLINITSSI